jgi:hypothetical protein
VCPHRCELRHFQLAHLAPVFRQQLQHRECEEPAPIQTRQWSSPISTGGATLTGFVLRSLARADEASPPCIAATSPPRRLEPRTECCRRRTASSHQRPQHAYELPAQGAQASVAASKLMCRPGPAHHHQWHTKACACACACGPAALWCCGVLGCCGGSGAPGKLVGSGPSSSRCHGCAHCSGRSRWCPPQTPGGGRRPASVAGRSPGSCSAACAPASDLRRRAREGRVSVAMAINDEFITPARRTQTFARRINQAAGRGRRSNITGVTRQLFGVQQPPPSKARRRGATEVACVERQLPRGWWHRQKRRLHLGGARCDRRWARQTDRQTDRQTADWRWKRYLVRWAACCELSTRHSSQMLPQTDTPIGGHVNSFLSPACFTF